MKVKNYQELIVWQRAMDLISARLRYLSGRATDELLRKAGEVGRLLNGLISSLTK